MNNLGRYIAPGEVIVLTHDRYGPEDPFNRAMRVQRGFGLQNYTIGAAIFGEWLDGAGKSRVEGTEIDVKETIAFNAGMRYERRTGREEESVG